jgi:peptidoglycan/xylan/chitin deacetylase (PgdA/CDA1 family)
VAAAAAALASVALIAGCSPATIPANVPPLGFVDGPPSMAAAKPVPATPAPSAPGPTDSPSPRAPAESIPVSGFALHVPILTYHVIAPWTIASSYALPNLAVSPELFDAQLRALSDAGWHSITVAELADLLAARTAPPPRTVVITIDDGHSDGATFALPILLKYHFVATFYVVAGRIGTPTNLTWSQIAQLVAAGMEIGDHTLDHVNLTRLSPADLRAQVLDAQAILASGLGAPPTTFAYPFGAFDAAVVDTIAQAGFTLAVTTEPGAFEWWGRRLEVPRLEVGSSLPPGDLLARLDRVG